MVIEEIEKLKADIEAGRITTRITVGATLWWRIQERKGKHGSARLQTTETQPRPPVRTEQAIVPVPDPLPASGFPKMFAEAHKRADNPDEP